MHRLRHRNRKRNKQRKILVISICSILLFMTAGYATMNTNLEINAKGNVVKKNTGGEQLLEMVDIVTTGDGLYKDSYEENVYTYRGATPNNYVTFNNELWRIISVNTSDNTIKIIRNAVLSDRVFDTSSNGRYNSSEYCNYSGGCNIWGSSSTLYDVGEINKISTLAIEINGTKYALPIAEAILNTYLNGEYYNELNATTRSMVKQDAIYKAGPLSSINISNLTTNIGYASQAIWKGKVALVDATEYMRTTTEANISSNNWIKINDDWWTMSPCPGRDSRHVWFMTSDGGLYSNNVLNTYGVRPVVTLKSEVQITSGDGSQNNSYQLSIES